MSLFRTREWWSTKIGDGEEFDGGSLVVGNVGDECGENMKIVTGSLQGVLRVHYPAEADFRVEDLLLEQDLRAPILQVSIGSFIPSASGIKAIAVLHPRKLGVYTIEAVGRQGDKASYYSLVKAYEHALGVEGGGHFTSFNMTHGGFGGVSRDFLCVQSMDGRLEVFEQDARAFTRRLTGILIPGPICYVSKIDALVVGNNEMGVDCYKYQALAASQGDREERNCEGISGARGLQTYWSCQLGEPALDLFVAKFSRALGPGSVDIVVVGERSLFTLREQGTVRLQKVLGNQTACACKYTVVASPGEEGAALTGTTVDGVNEEFDTIVEEENLIIATETDQLMVFKDLQLIWQASVRKAPVSLTVAKFGSRTGMVCLLDEEGILSVCYQGTDPPTSSVVASDVRELDYEKIDQEHQKLLQIIRRSQTEAARPPPGKLTLQVQVPQSLDAPSLQQPRSAQDGKVLEDPINEALRQTPTDVVQLDPVKLTARFVVTNSGKGKICDATLHISPPPGIQAEPSSVLLPPFRGSVDEGADRGEPSDVAPIVVTVVFKAERETGCLPSSLVGQASVVYIRQYGCDAESSDSWSEPLAARCDVQLPFVLYGRLVEITKSGGAHIFTFTTNKPPLSLSTLFEDMIAPQTFCGSSIQDSGKPDLSGDSGGTGDYPPSVGRKTNGGDCVEFGAGEDTALSFRYWAVNREAGSSRDASVFASKNSGKYRVQGEWLPALCLMATELLRRLRKHFRDRDHGGRPTEFEEPRLRIEFTQALPLPEFYQIIDEHFERRRELRALSESLNRVGHQYRVVEKRLLARFKNRNPSSLNKLDLLSKETYSRLTELSEKIERAQGHLAHSAWDLCCAGRLLALLAQCRFQLSSKDHALLLAHLYLDVTDTDDQGWEESADVAMTHLLRTSLAKIAKDYAPGSALGQPPLVMPEDTTKLKKHISIVCDRLNKGARLAMRPATPPSSCQMSAVETDSVPLPMLSLTSQSRAPGLEGAGGA